MVARILHAPYKVSVFPAYPQFPNIIGGTTLAEFNLISGNASSGIMIANHSSENTISGNIIGLNANLNATLPNNSSGISLASSSNHNVIGGTSAGSPLNYICGNNGDGIHLYGGMTVQNEISGNLIGYTGLGNNGHRSLSGHCV